MIAAHLAFEGRGWLRRFLAFWKGADITIELLGRGGSVV